MKSIQEVFEHPAMTTSSVLAVFICKKEHSAYTENRRRFVAGWTGWWLINEKRTFDGIVVLIESSGFDGMEIWAGLTTKNSGRLGMNSERRWKLGVAGAFEYLGMVNCHSTKKFLGKQPGNGVTYIEVSRRNQPKNSRISSKASKRQRGFSVEFSGDRTVPPSDGGIATSNHGVVVTALSQWLISQGINDVDNRCGYWDLHAISPDGSAQLFEVKTDSSPTSIYGAIGQLYIYGQQLIPSSKVIVIPVGDGADRWGTSLENLGITILEFDLSEQKNVIFIQRGSHRSHQAVAYPRPSAALHSEIQ